jgi:hypothetical protein
VTESLRGCADNRGWDGGFIIYSLSDPFDRIPELFRKAITSLDCRLLMPGKREEIQIPRRPETMQDGVRLPGAIGRYSRFSRRSCRDISLSLIPYFAMQGARTQGRGAERDTVHRTRNHHATIRIRTRPVKREFRKRQPSRGAPGPKQRGDGGEQE